MSAKLRIGILGLGQIGGSIATRLSLVSSGYTTIGFDLRPELLEASLQTRAVSQIAGSEQELIDTSDVVVVALPITEIIVFLKRRQSVLKGKLAVIDTGSVKQEIMSTAEELQLFNFVGGHPLAGTEKRGLASWNGSMFESASLFLTRLASTDQNAIETVNKIVLSLGATPILIDAEAHDRMFAITSSLSHLAAYALRRTVAGSRNLPETMNLLNSPSFLGATRVADSDPEMVFQMLWHNRQHVANGLSDFIAQLQSTWTALMNHDPSALREVLTLPQTLTKPQ